jgi:hypothetical protein
MLIKMKNEKRKAFQTVRTPQLNII